jgi:hypothetical protein
LAPAAGEPSAFVSRPAIEPVGNTVSLSWTVWPAASGIGAAALNVFAPPFHQRVEGLVHAR